jgi:hypothetical protein
LQGSLAAFTFLAVFSLFLNLKSPPEVLINTTEVLKGPSEVLINTSEVLKSPSEVLINTSEVLKNFAKLLKKGIVLIARLSGF